MENLQLFMVDMFSSCIGLDHYNINLILNSHDILFLGFAYQILAASPLFGIPTLFLAYPSIDYYQYHLDQIFMAETMVTYNDRQLQIFWSKLILFLDIRPGGPMFHLKVGKT